MSASPIGVNDESALVAGPFRGLAGKSDKRLVELAQRGDTHAVEILYDRYATAILRYCRSLLRSTQEAEDVQQEVFLQALSALRDGAGPDTFRPWLYRVAHNACISHMRAKRPTLTAVDGDFVAAATTVQPASDEREELRQLLDDLSALPEVQRGALLLREMDGFSYEQVGQVLGLPVTTVRSTIFRARSTLQGLAEARDAKCTEIQAELSRLADRRGRRSRRITSHLKVCGDCRQFRDGLRERQTILRGFMPVLPLGMIEGAETIAAEGAGIATAGAAFGASSGFGLLGGGGAAKLIAAAASTCALVGGAGTQIGVLGGGSGAAVDAESSTVAAEPSVTARVDDARRVACLQAPRVRDEPAPAPGPTACPTPRPGPSSGDRRPTAASTHRERPRRSPGRGRPRLGPGWPQHTPRARSPNRQWGSALAGGQFHSLAASETGFMLADDGGPRVRRHEREPVRDSDGDRIAATRPRARHGRHDLRAVRLARGSTRAVDAGATTAEQELTRRPHRAEPRRALRPSPPRRRRHRRRRARARVRARARGDRSRDLHASGRTRAPSLRRRPVAPGPSEPTSTQVQPAPSQPRLRRPRRSRRRRILQLRHRDPRTLGAARLKRAIVRRPHAP